MRKSTPPFSRALRSNRTSFAHSAAEPPKPCSRAIRACRSMRPAKSFEIRTQGTGLPARNGHVRQAPQGDVGFVALAEYSLDDDPDIRERLRRRNVGRHELGFASISIGRGLLVSHDALTL